MARLTLIVARWIVRQAVAFQSRRRLQQYRKGWNWAEQEIKDSDDPALLLDYLGRGPLFKSRSKEFVLGAQSACRNRLSKEV